MTETNLERIQRVVSSYDPEAGRRLRYHITQAQADEAYVGKISFNLEFNLKQRRDLDALFIFTDTPEGHDYWWLVHMNTQEEEACSGCREN